MSSVGVRSLSIALVFAAMALLDVATTADLGGRTEHLAADGKGYVFLNMQDVGTLLKIDARDLKVTSTWSVAGCGQPSSMDIDRAHSRVFIGCRSGELAIVDSVTG